MAIKRFLKYGRRLGRWLKRHQNVTLLACGAVIIGGVVMNVTHRRQQVDMQSYQPLLRLIARAESKGNYNAYFGNAHNTKVRFTDMTIREVLTWQAEYVANGSPSSAVGRYQFLNTTLEGLVNEHNINTSTKFNEATQDALAARLLERRGGEAYVNQELSKQDFAANLAKEWASLPMIKGVHPEKSYYDADGLNKALVEPKEVLRAVDKVRAK